jgi:hypothetical protein
LDILAVNQHKGPMMEEDLKGMTRVIEETERTVVVIDKHGACFSRAWCLLEMQIAASCKQMESEGRTSSLSSCRKRRSQKHHLGDGGGCDDAIVVDGEPASGGSAKNKSFANTLCQSWPVRGSSSASEAGYLRKWNFCPTAAIDDELEITNNNNDETCGAARRTSRNRDSVEPCLKPCGDIFSLTHSKRKLLALAKLPNVSLKSIYVGCVGKLEMGRGLL